MLKSKIQLNVLPSKKAVVKSKIRQAVSCLSQCDNQSWPVKYVSYLSTVNTLKVDSRNYVTKYESCR